MIPKKLSLKRPWVYYSDSNTTLKCYTYIRDFEISVGYNRLADIDMLYLKNQ